MRNGRTTGLHTKGAQLTTPWRDRFLAASPFWLRGSGGKDNELVQRTRAALAG